MYCTENGCSCHYLYDKKCISCLERKKQADKGICCNQCGVGIWSSSGDYERMNGKCTECYYKLSP